MAEVVRVRESPATDADALHVTEVAEETVDVRRTIPGALLFSSDCFLARNSALRLERGGATGGRVLATAIDSARLWPGTPTKVPSVLGLAELNFGAPPAVTGRRGVGCPVRKAEARVGRGAMAGGAVLATTNLRLRLYPGVSDVALVVDALGRGGITSGWPVRSMEARVGRGVIVGGAVDATAMLGAGDECKVRRLQA